MSLICIEALRYGTLKTMTVTFMICYERVVSLQNVNIKWLLGITSDSAIIFDGQIAGLNMVVQQFKALLVFVLHISSCCSIPLSDFYPYGTSEGDSVLPANDDGSSGEIEISILFPYFDRNHNSLFVSNHFFYLVPFFFKLIILNLRPDYILSGYKVWLVMLFTCLKSYVNSFSSGISYWSFLESQKGNSLEIKFFFNITAFKKGVVTSFNLQV